MLLAAFVFGGCSPLEVKKSDLANDVKQGEPPNGVKACKIRYFDLSVPGRIQMGETTYMPMNEANARMEKIRNLPGFTSSDMRQELICL